MIATRNVSEVHSFGHIYCSYRKVDNKFSDIYKIAGNWPDYGRVSQVNKYVLGEFPLENGLRNYNPTDAPK